MWSHRVYLHQNIWFNIELLIVNLLKTQPFKIDGGKVSFKRNKRERQKIFLLILKENVSY